MSNELGCFVFCAVCVLSCVPHFEFCGHSKGVGHGVSALQTVVPLFLIVDLHAPVVRVRTVRKGGDGWALLSSN